MKLFLASKHLQNAEALTQLVNKSAAKVKAYLVLNAFDNYPADRRDKHVSELKASLAKTGYDFMPLDLRDYLKTPSKVRQLLETADLLWVSGGNVFYLRWLFAKTGLDIALPALTSKGLVYAGDSAGAAVLGPDMHGLNLLDDPSQAPDLMYEGVGLTAFMTLPHWGNERYAAEIGETKKQLEQHNSQVIAISDDQAIIVNGDNVQIIG